MAAVDAVAGVFGANEGPVIGVLLRVGVEEEVIWDVLIGIVEEEALESGSGDGEAGGCDSGAVLASIDGGAPDTLLRSERMPYNSQIRWRLLIKLLHKEKHYCINYCAL